MKYTVTHNGYGVEFFNTMEACEIWIAKKVNERMKDSGKKLNFLSHMTNEAGHQCHVYQYNTLYCEVFTVTTNERCVHM